MRHAEKDFKQKNVDLLMAMQSGVQVRSPKETLCLVCGDKASGKHYGVSSCDGCRGFFKRSIRRQLDYICKEGGRCVVDVSRRNQCQACRFRKCLQVKMKRDAVQHERAPRSVPHPMPSPFSSIPYSLPRRPPPSHFPGLNGGLCGGLGPGLGAGLAVGAAPTPTSSLDIPATAVILYPPPSSLGVKRHFDANSLGLPIAFPPLAPPVRSSLMPREKEDEVTSSEEARGQPSPDLPHLTPVTVLPGDPMSALPFFDNVYESAAKILFLAVKWARSIPAFHQLTSSDQSLLLEDGWPDLFVLSAAEWHLTIDHEVLVAGAVSPVCHRSALTEDARKLEEAVTRFNRLRVDNTEFACLKALVLFKSEARGLHESVQVEVLSDQTHVMLAEYCSARGKPRLGRLLMLLPAVRAISSRSIQELFFRQTVGDVPIERLLGDMLNSP